MKCNIIKDLFSSYLDGICSNDTTEAVEEHIKNCPTCHQTLKLLQQSDNMSPSSEETIQAKHPFKIIHKKIRSQIIIAILTTSLVMIVGSLIIQESGLLSDLFFPIKFERMTLNEATEEWQTFIFRNNDYLVFDSLLFQKEIINSAANEEAVSIRIKDLNHNIVIDSLTLEPGTSVKLKELNRFENYILEIKTKSDDIFLNFS